MADRIVITTPVARLVAGSLYRGSLADTEGNPHVYKTGPNAGQTHPVWFFGVAITKEPGKQWWETAWGSQIYKAGSEAFPQACGSQSFSWKVEDGDSQTPNKKGKKPADNEGYPGNWIIKFNSNFAPNIVEKQAMGWTKIIADDVVKCGYYVQVNFNAIGNMSNQNPGVLFNVNAVAFIKAGAEISFGPSYDEMGFSDTAQAVASAPPATPTLGTAALTPASAVAAPAPGILNPSTETAVPSPVPSAALPPAPPSPSNHTMTAAAGGIAYEAYVKQGWTDAQLISNGLMLV